jgi:hypothetical protein
LIISLHCSATLNDWGTGKNTMKHTFPFTGQNPHGSKPLHQQTLTQTFAQANGEKSRRKEPDSKITEYNMLPKFMYLQKLLFYSLKTLNNKQ